MGILNNEIVIVAVLIKYFSDFDDNYVTLFFYDYVKTALKFYIYVKSALEGIATKINLHFF